jgi:hypothetical protein
MKKFNNALVAVGLLSFGLLGACGGSSNGARSAADGDLSSDERDAALKIAEARCALFEDVDCNSFARRILAAECAQRFEDAIAQRRGPEPRIFRVADLVIDARQTVRRHAIF